MHNYYTWLALYSRHTLWSERSAILTLQCFTGRSPGTRMSGSISYPRDSTRSIILGNLYLKDLKGSKLSMIISNNVIKVVEDKGFSLIMRIYGWSRAFLSRDVINRFSLCCSNTLTVMIAWERFRAVCHPNHFRSNNSNSSLSRYNNKNNNNTTVDPDLK